MREGLDRVGGVSTSTRNTYGILIRQALFLTPRLFFNPARSAFAPVLLYNYKEEQRPRGEAEKHRANEDT